MDKLVQAEPSARNLATVIIPVYNEEEGIGQCLQALLHQSLPHSFFEVIVLLNNCTDASPQIARGFQEAHPAFALHLGERWLPKQQANVGTARRLLMDEASRRLSPDGAILSTDGDSVVDHYWVERNIQLLSEGADAVGGEISLHPNSYARLSPLSQWQYCEDALYLHAVTHLESILDPDPHDPWPRHHHHFGASLACTNSMYGKLGGLPEADCLEDVKFVKALIRADGRLRHSPEVQVVTAARTSGRARIGLASQLREWQEDIADPLVDSAAFLKLYFEWRARLRCCWNEGMVLPAASLRELEALTAVHRDKLAEPLKVPTTFGGLLEELDLRDRLWRGMVPVRRVGKRSAVTEQIRCLISSLLSAKHRSDTALPDCREPASILAGRENIRVPDLLWPDSPEQLA